jgi:hypothetical protein
VDLYHQGGGDSPVYDEEHMPPEFTGESDPSDNPERDCASPESSVGELYADGKRRLISLS